MAVNVRLELTTSGFGGTMKTLNNNSLNIKINGGVSSLNGQNKVTLKVKDTANKTQIKIAVQQIFNVKVVDVKIVNVLPRAKRVGRYEGKVSGYKKAIVTVSPEDQINVISE